MESARQKSTLEKKRLKNITRSLLESKLLPEPQTKPKTNEIQPINPEIFSRFKNWGKTKELQTADGKLPVTECRQKNKSFKKT